MTGTRNLLTGLDVTNQDNRLIVADRLEEDGRTEEAALLRGESQVRVYRGRVRPVANPRRTYFVNYPRNFGNEYTVYVCETPEIAARLEAEFPDAERISRQEAIRLGITRPRQARRTGEQWFGGFETGYVNSCRYDSIEDQIDAAMQNTLKMIEECEFNREAAERFHQQSWE